MRYGPGKKSPRRMSKEIIGDKSRRKSSANRSRGQHSSSRNLKQSLVSQRHSGLYSIDRDINSSRNNSEIHKIRHDSLLRRDSTQIQGGSNIYRSRGSRDYGLDQSSILRRAGNESSMIDAKDEQFFQKLNSNLKRNMSAHNNSLMAHG